MSFSLLAQTVSNASYLSRIFADVFQLHAEKMILKMYLNFLFENDLATELRTRLLFILKINDIHRLFFCRLHFPDRFLR